MDSKKKILTVTSILRVLPCTLILFFFLTTIKIVLEIPKSLGGLLEGITGVDGVGDAMDLVDGTNLPLSGWNLTTGHHKLSGDLADLIEEFVKTDTVTDPFIPMILLLILPIIILVIWIFYNRITAKKTCIISMVCAGIDLIAWIVFPIYISNAIKDMGDKGVLKVHLTFFYWLTIIVLVLILLLSILIFDNRISVDKSINADKDTLYKGIAKVRKKTREIGENLNEKTKPENVNTINEPKVTKPEIGIVNNSTNSERIPNPSDEPVDNEKTDDEMRQDIEVRYCTNCGNQLNPGALFCPNCGNKITNSESEEI